MPLSNDSRVTADVIRDLNIDDRRRLVAGMVRSGWTMREIARQLGVSHSTIGRDVIALRAQWAAEAADQFKGFLGLQMMRLNALLNTHWEDALAGNHQATKSVLDVMSAMNALYGVPHQHNIAVIEEQKAAAEGKGDEIDEFLKRVEVRKLELTEVMYAFEGNGSGEQPNVIEVKPDNPD